MYFERFEPIALRVERLGPFDEEFKLDFMQSIDSTHEDLRPSRFYLLASQNAKGKTTLLEAFALAMSILGKDIPSFSIIEDLVARKGRIQLDVRVTIYSSGDIRSDLILSIAIGGKIYEYLSDELDLLNAKDGQEFIVASGQTLKLISTESNFISEWFIETNNKYSFDGIFNETRKLPTLLYFTAERGVARPPSNEIVIAKPSNLEFKPCHVFSREQGDWRNSIDNLFCWFAWISDLGIESQNSHFKKACELVNIFVVDEPNKALSFLNRDPPEPYIKTSGNLHRLDRLSSGERSRLQIILRVASLMTAHTIVLIDELELHLHPIWQHHLFDELISIMNKYLGLRIYYTTHSKELVERGIGLTNSMNEILVVSHKIL